MNLKITIGHLFEELEPKNGGKALTENDSSHMHFWNEKYFKASTVSLSLTLYQICKRSGRYWQ